LGDLVQYGLSLDDESNCKALEEDSSRFIEDFDSDCIYNTEEELQSPLFEEETSLSALKDYYEENCSGLNLC